MDIWYVLMIPFTWLLKTFYSVFNSYGLAIILFSLVIKVVLFPLSLKGKRSMIQMNMIQSKVNKIEKEYAKDPQEKSEKLQELYTKEGVNPMGGCLWSLLPLFILIPVYAVVRRPLKYWLGLTETQITAATEALVPTWSYLVSFLFPFYKAASWPLKGLLGTSAITGAATGAGITFGAGLTLSQYPEIYIMSALYKDPNILSTVRAAVPDANIFGINFTTLGIDLSQIPTWKFWEDGWNWPSIGLFLIPVLVVVTSFFSSQIMMKTNNQVSGTENSQAAQSGKIMQWTSPIMMAWISFHMPAAMGIYIAANSVFAVIQELLCAKLLKADYEKAREAARLREIEEKEEEKRLRREKAERRAREAEEARLNKGKKKEKTDEEPKMTPEQREASRVGMRQYARGRAYDPSRYGGVTPYHDGESTI